MCRELILFFKQKTAYEMRISDWSSDVCSSDLPPCTLQHWQGLRGVSERMLADLGFDLQPFNDSHLCCGSAGTYSVTQPELAKSLRDRKLAIGSASCRESVCQYV